MFSKMITTLSDCKTPTTRLSHNSLCGYYCQFSISISILAPILRFTVNKTPSHRTHTSTNLEIENLAKQNLILKREIEVLFWYQILSPSYHFCWRVDLNIGNEICWFWAYHQTKLEHNTFLFGVSAKIMF